MPSCVVKNCKNNSKTHKKYDGITFHLFPINNEIIIKWIVAIRKSRNDPEWLPSKTSVVCSDHFENNDLYTTNRGLRRVTRSGYPKELEQDMENYIEYKIMGSVKRMRLNPNCIPSRFDCNRQHKSASEEYYLDEAKRQRMSISKDSAQDYLEEDNVKALSSCIKDSQTAVGVPSMENIRDKADQFIQVQEHTATEVVLTQKHEEIQACIKKLCDPSEANSKDEDDLETSSDEAITSSDYVCQACWHLAQSSSAGEGRKLGHRNICVRCGCSYASKANHLLHHGSIRESKINYIIQKWITPRTVTPECVLCTECLTLLQERANTNSEEGLSVPALGHRKICFSCGKSILRTTSRTYPVRQDRPERNILIRNIPLHLISRLERVCAACMRSAKREVQRQRHDGIGDPPKALKYDLEAERSVSSGNEDTCYQQSDAQDSQTAERTEEDHTRVFIVKVFHYLEHEFEVLKKMDAKMILINLSKLQYRTAMAVGVSETTVLEILQEEARRNAAMQESVPQNFGKPAPAANAGMPQRPPGKRRRVCKRQNLAESSSEASDIEEVTQPNVAQDITIEPEGEMLVVKAEPFEYYNEEPAINIEPVNASAINKEQVQKDPISLEVKSESPDEEEMKVSNQTYSIQPSSSKRKRISRKNDHTSTRGQDQKDPISLDAKVKPPDEDMLQHRQDEYCRTGASSSHRRVIELDGQHRQDEYCRTGASSSHRRVIELDGRCLLRVGEVKEETDNDEEGFS